MPRLEIDLPAQFAFSTDIPIRISDINRGRHLGHTAVLVIMEEARVRFLNSLGYAERDTNGVGHIIADAGIIYKKQGYYGQTLKVEIAVTDFTSRGCDLIYKISDTDSGAEIARAKTGMLFYDYQQQKTVPVPPDFKGRFAS
ncbi:MAG: thioesterase family protein [Dehalococcoidales bacterium]|nr:thioesterase family protein [Dehalococcoidales bacterium]